MAETKLSKYRSKRDFSKTAEPSDEAEASPSPRLRFVIQKHAATRLHYDLRLEMDGVFKSWAVTRGPSLDPHDKRLAVETEDHPLAYGDFEGTIPKGQYGGGTVQLWDRGYWSVEGRKTPEKALESGDLKFTLEGKRLHGSWVLVRMKNDRDGGKRTNWLLIKHRDAAAREGDGEAILKEDRSVASGRTMADIAKGKGQGAEAVHAGRRRRGQPGRRLEFQPRRRPNRNARKAACASRSRAKRGGAADMPDFIDPQLCETVSRPPSGADWLHEIKFDGYRMQLRVEDGAAVLRTRKGLDWTGKFGAIAAEADSASRLHHRRRDRCAGRIRQAGFQRAAGRPVRAGYRRAGVLRLRLLVRRLGRPAARCRLPSASAGCSNCWRKARTRRRISASSSISKAMARRCCARRASLGLEGIISKRRTRPTNPGGRRAGPRPRAARARKS